jgi:transposase InsO family protein
MDQQFRERVALFRYSVIGSLVSAELGYGQLQESVSDLATRRYQIPGSNRSSVGEGTILDWYYAYRKDGIEALKPRQRSDAGVTRAIPPDVARIIVDTKKEKPKVSVKSILSHLVGKGLIRPGELAPATVYRHLNAHLSKTPPSKTGRTSRRFAHRFPNDCWQGDCMHGPYIKLQGLRRPRKTYLLAFIDDATRLIVGAEFFFAESAANVKALLRRALLTYGVPRKLYLDNGPCYRAEELQIACATIGCALIHTTPYYPEGKGKIERYFRTVQSDFLPWLRDVTTLQDLNHCFDLWLQNKYNRAPHSGINGQHPLQCFLEAAHGHVRPLPTSIDPVDLFCKRTTRKVDKLATFRIDSVVYQTQQHLIGTTIDARYDPDEPSRKVNVYHQGVFIEHAYPVDFGANANSKRTPL